MSRRLRILATIILLMFAVIVAQSANIQFFRAPALIASPSNPRNTNPSAQFPRGEILAANGAVLAYSAKQTASSNPNIPYFPYRRVYPFGSLMSGVVGYSSPYYGVYGIEEEYNGLLAAHQQPPQSFEQLLAPTSAADTVTLTIEPALQQVARSALKGIDGAAVALDPKTGAVLAMYSNPNYNPVPLTSPIEAVDTAARIRYIKPDANGFPPLGLVATQQTFPPGSTFKVITTAAAVVSKPADLLKDFNSNRDGGACTTLPDTTSVLCNSGGKPCGGDIAEMLPPSCDPGFALLGIDLGADYMFKAATSFGYDSIPPLDLPNPLVSSSYFPTAASFANDIPGLAKSAIGQQNVRASALQDALVAAAVGNGGVEMTPHLLNFVTGPNGNVIERYKDSVWKTPLTATQAGFIVPLMEKVVTEGTASGVGFPAQYDVAAKTGTAQTGNVKKETDDWLIAFAPATNPTIAVAVVLPFQPTANFGATVAGPVVKALIDAFFEMQAGTYPTATTTTTVHK
jgi:peptidoglycan glycosyltransferase